MADDTLKRAEITIRKRVECEERAFHVVHKLVEGCVDEEYFSECGKRISQANYDDVVEERSITKLCGYPLCDQDLPNVPKKKYHISTKANKVYDISERKKFCSNQCFKASNIFKQQIPESPVWARDKEKIKIDISPHKGVPGLVGDEVIGERPKHILERELETLKELDTRFGPKSEENEIKSALREEDCSNKSDTIRNGEQDSTSKTDSPTELVCAESSNPPRDDDTSIVQDLQGHFDDLDLNKSEAVQIKSPKPNTFRLTTESELVQIKSPKSKTFESAAEKPQQSSPNSKLEQLQMLLNKRKNVLSGMMDLQEAAESKENQHQDCDSGSKTCHTKPQTVEKCPKRVEKRVKKKETPLLVAQSPLCLICDILKKWVSVSTVEYLHFKLTNSESVDLVGKKFSDLQIQVDCTNVSKKMDVQEKQLASFLGDNTDHGAVDLDDHKEKKGIPDYKVLKDEAEQFQLKVTEFITGKSSKQNSEEKNDVTENTVHLPTVDAFDQSQIRSKIVLERLDKFLPDLLIPMGLSVQDVSSHVRELVYTFRLERDTIIFKPAEWTLVSLTLLKMLSFRVKAVQEAFERDSTIQHFSVLLKGIKHTLEDLDVCTRELLSDATVIFDETK